MIKRCFDFLAALFGLLLLCPILLIIALLVWIQDLKSPLFKQERVGRGGKTFLMLKFRTMVERAEILGPSITIGQDPRITKVGRVLRKTKLDELPQLWNVLKGDMSFVGPRPEVKRYVDLYKEEQKKVLSYRPGITDPASFKYFNEQELLGDKKDPEKFYVEVLMPEKIRINLEYQESAHFFSDIFLIGRTILKVFVK